MDTLKKIGLVVLFLGGFVSIRSETFANNDYVCSYYQTACNCTWETTWREDGTKHCVGTKNTITRIGNTRVWCPGSSSPYGTETYRNKGGYMFGDIVSAPVSCDLVEYDNIAPAASATLSGQLAISSYTGEIACTGSGCDPMPCDLLNGASHPDYCTAISTFAGFHVTPRCTDNESGCKPTPSSFFLAHDGAQTFKVYDKANNPSTCIVTGDGSWSVNCTGSVLPGNTITAVNTWWCVYSNGSSCVPDTTPPRWEITYAPSSCTNSNVSVTNTCISDLNPDGRPGSGCRAAPENVGHPDTDSDGIADLIAYNSNGTVGIVDAAGNLTDLPWSVNWIDKTAPTFRPMTLNGNLVGTGFYAVNQKAGTWNLFAISAYDVGSLGCLDSNLQYQIVISGADSKTITGTTPRSWAITTRYLGLTKAWDYHFSVTIADQAGNTKTMSVWPVTIYPGDFDLSQSNIVRVTNPSDSKYANASDNYVYRITLRDQFGNPIYNKSLASVNQEGNPTIKTDMSDPTTPSWADALLENILGTSDSSGNIDFRVVSMSPGTFLEKFAIGVPTWGDNYANDGGQKSGYLTTSSINSFKKPFVWSLAVTSSPYQLVLGTMFTLGLNITKHTTLSSYVVEDFRSKIHLTDPTDHEFQSLGTLTDLSGTPSIDMTIGALTDAGTTISPGVKISGNAIVSYSLNGSNIRYQLTGGDAARDSANITYAPNNAFVGAKVLWVLQWQGKQAVTGQQTNFTDISKSTARAEIKKEAYALIAGRKPDGSILNGVKYVNSDISISWDQGYETLIVNNANVRITGDLNVAGKKFGIIVLRDDQSKTEIANVYVNPDVDYINAVIYADGGFISSGFKSWEDMVGSYKDSSTRTAKLSHQLVLKGSLFTRNTIGGAVLGTSGSYILPGGSKTKDFNLAMMYDLNYVRRGNIGYDTPVASGGTKDYNSGKTDPFVIVYNPSIQIDPPKGF